MSSNTSKETKYDVSEHEDSRSNTGEGRSAYLLDGSEL